MQYNDENRPLFYYTSEEFRILMRELFTEYFNQQKNNMQKQDTSFELMTKKEVANLYKVSVVTIRDWVKCGFLPEPIRKKRRVYFLRSAIIEASQNRNFPKKNKKNKSED